MSNLYLTGRYGYGFRPTEQLKKEFEAWENSSEAEDFISQAKGNKYRRADKVGALIISDTEDQWFFSAEFKWLDGIWEGCHFGFNKHEITPPDELVKSVDEAFKAFLDDPETPDVFLDLNSWERFDLILGVTS